MVLSELREIPIAVLPCPENPRANQILVVLGNTLKAVRISFQYQPPLVHKIPEIRLRVGDLDLSQRLYSPLGNNFFGPLSLTLDESRRWQLIDGAGLVEIPVIEGALEALTQVGEPRFGVAAYGTGEIAAGAGNKHRRHHEVLGCVHPALAVSTNSGLYLRETSPARSMIDLRPQHDPSDSWLKTEPFPSGLHLIVEWSLYMSIESELIDLCKQGDRKAFGRLVTEHLVSLRRLIRYRLNDPSSEDDGRFMETAANEYRLGDGCSMGAGFYNVTIGGSSQECIRVIDTLGQDEREELVEAYLNRQGRTVYWRPYNGRHWRVGTEGVTKDSKPWDERFPDHDGLVVNDRVYAHWYDCLTDQSLRADE